MERRPYSRKKPIRPAEMTALKSWNAAARRQLEKTNPFSRHRQQNKWVGPGERTRRMRAGPAHAAFCKTKPVRPAEMTALKSWNAAARRQLEKTNPFSRHS
jgi:hypothetical protein